MRIKTVISGIISVALVGAGLALIGIFLLGQSSESTPISQGGPEDSNLPAVTTKDGQGKTSQEAPEDKTLTITIPKMSRIEEDTIPTTVGDDEKALKNNAAIHLKGSGFPWQKEANVYLAGHRMGYPSTESFLTFYDLNKLENGDKAFVTDAEGRKYTYRVFQESVVSPTDLSVTKPIKGKNILTLQSCTLPDYSKRLIVRAELVEESSA